MEFSRRVRSSWLAVLVATASACSGCREQPSAEAASSAQQVDEIRPAQRGDMRTVELESEADRVIRQELDTVIDHDSSLKNCAIRFTVAAGDVRVTGTVGTETERQKINELAMQVNGVKSVANAVRVSPAQGGN